MSYNTAKDFELPLSGEKIDGISSLAFNPTKGGSNLIVATSWDSKIRLWELNSPYSGVGKAATTADAPILCSTWSNDGKVFFGGCDQKLRLWIPQTNQCQPIGQHDAPIKAVSWVDDLQMVLTGSWDKTLRFWDGKSPNTVHTTQLPERVYCMDVKKNLCVVGTAERVIHIYDLRKPNVEFKKMPSPLKYQSRVVSCFPDVSGFALGSIEGRVAIQYLSDNDASRNFAFKCHRDGNDVYSVNSISFHNTHGTFATAGSDGTFHFWDKDSKQRLKQFPKVSQPICAATFNAEGNLYAYAASYDWGKGQEHYNPNVGGTIYIHSVTDAEIKKRPK